MPFAIQHGVSSIEVWECSLDYAFGVETTTWVPSAPPPPSSGCAEWGVNSSSVGPSGDSNYVNVLVNTLIRQPRGTSLRTGTSILRNGTQF